VPEYGSLVPFEDKNLSSQLLPLDSDLSDLDPTGEPNRNYIGGSTDGPATLFVATRSQTLPYTDWNVLNCSMYNATYVVNIFSDSNSRSLPQISEVRMENSFAYSAQAPRSGLRMPAPDPSQWTAVGKSGYNIISLPEEAVSSPSFNQSLSAAIEELFQNMTLSLFSDSRFVRDLQDPVDVTIAYTRNLYSYSQKNLIISYGIALSLALLASIAGCIAIYWNGASYTQKFSTVLRTTTGLGQVVAENDRSGADPLPKYLSRARVDLGRAEEKTMELGQVSETVGERSAMIDSEGDWRKEPGIVHERSLSEER
jgi:hypothetical protein